jgi:hypothetical protein
MQIVDHGGVSLLVDETGIDSLELLFTAWESNGIPPQGFLFELLDAKK